jgi:hypothetical protein
MKKSTKVTLTAVTAMALASCGRSRRDPCDQASFNEMACQEAVSRGGYHWGGTWYPMVYHYPYRTYVSRGGRVYSAPASSYARPSSSSGVTRGGFGSSGSSHSSGS